MRVPARRHLGWHFRSTDSKNQPSRTRYCPEPAHSNPSLSLARFHSHSHRLRPELSSTTVRTSCGRKGDGSGAAHSGCRCLGGHSTFASKSSCRGKRDRSHYGFRRCDSSWMCLLVEVAWTKVPGVQIRLASGGQGNGRLGQGEETRAPDTKRREIKGAKGDRADEKGRVRECRLVAVGWREKDGPDKSC